MIKSFYNDIAHIIRFKNCRILYYSYNAGVDRLGLAERKQEAQECDARKAS